MDELLSLCASTSEWLSQRPSAKPAARRLQQEKALRERAEKIDSLLHDCGPVHAPNAAAPLPPETLSAVAWNIERGKNFDSLLQAFRSHPELAGADFHFLTEVDWGMARTGNRHVAAELGSALGYYAYFAPSYYNFTKGHGTERHLSGENSFGLHGKAILSRYPLAGLRVVPLPNATDKLRSKEARLGQKRALIGEIAIGSRKLSVACVHLDAFSSPADRVRQLQPVAAHSASHAHALMGGDWNTNTLDSRRGASLFASVARQWLTLGPSRAIRDHYPFPEQRFDRELFKMLGKQGLEFTPYNERGEGTFDLLCNDRELGKMASDQFPGWILRWINRLVEKNGGKLSLKLDWFAGKGLECLEKRVLRLTPGIHHPANARPSDHHPIMLKFRLSR